MSDGEGEGRPSCGHSSDTVVTDKLNNQTKPTIKNNSMLCANMKQTPESNCETHINSVSLPNGCLKHSLEENGRVRLTQNADNNSHNCEETSHDSDDNKNRGTGGTSVELSCENSLSDEEAACEQNLTKPCSDCSSDAGDSGAKTKTTGSQNGEQPNTNSVNSTLEPISDTDTIIEQCTQGVSRISIEKSTPPQQDAKSDPDDLENTATTGECSSKTSTNNQRNDAEGELEYVVYESELQMPDIMRLITKDLSEPYSIYTYRYFIHNWPRLCFLSMDGGKCVGAIVCKHDLHKKMVRRGYIAMLAVDQNYRRRGIGSHLVMKAIRAMVAEECDEVVLETEITNKAALRLYENLGFLRDKRLFRYYLNGVDALRLKLWLR